MKGISLAHIDKLAGFENDFIDWKLRLLILTSSLPDGVVVEIAMLWGQINGISLGTTVEFVPYCKLPSPGGVAVFKLGCCVQKRAESLIKYDVLGSYPNSPSFGGVAVTKSGGVFQIIG